MITHYCNLPKSYTLCGAEFPCSYVGSWRFVNCESCRKLRVFRSRDKEHISARRKKYKRQKQDNCKMKIGTHSLTINNRKCSKRLWGDMKKTKAHKVNRSLDKQFGKSVRKKFDPYVP